MMESEQKNRPRKPISESGFMSKIYVQGLKYWKHTSNPLILLGGPSGTRTRVTGVRGRRPRPLDDGT